MKKLIAILAVIILTLANTACSRTYSEAEYNSLQENNNELKRELRELRATIQDNDVESQEHIGMEEFIVKQSVALALEVQENSLKYIEELSSIDMYDEAFELSLVPYWKF